MKSSFIQILEKYLSAVIGRMVDRYNDRNQPPTLLHRTYLTEEYSADLVWSSSEFSNNIIAADVVSMDSSLPLKKRDSLSTAVGQIPKLGIAFRRGEKFLSDIQVMTLRGANEMQIAARVLQDATRCVNGIETRKEILFLQALSTGTILVNEPDTPSIGVRVTFNYKEENIFGTIGPAWGGADATPIDDLEQLVDKSNIDGVTIARFFISKRYLNHIRKSNQGKILAATFSGQVIVNMDAIQTPSRDVMIAALEDEFGAPFTVVDSSFRIENNDGSITTVKPYEEAVIVAVPSDNIGRLVYGTLAEETRPVNDVTYAKAGTHILIAEYSETNPLREVTTGQALCLPVIDNAGNTYILQANKTESSIRVDVSMVCFPKSASSRTVKLLNSTNVNITSKPEWITTSVSDGNINLSAQQNTGVLRRGIVTLRDNLGNTIDIDIEQAAGS